MLIGVCSDVDSTCGNSGHARDSKRRVERSAIRPTRIPTSVTNALSVAIVAGSAAAGGAVALFLVVGLLLSLAGAPLAPTNARSEYASASLPADQRLHSVSTTTRRVRQANEYEPVSALSL